MKKLCGECGKREVEPLAIPGRRLPFRSFPSLEVPHDLAIPTCRHCGTEWIDPSFAAKLDAALEGRAARVLTELARAAIESLSPTTTQRDLEATLGLSAGYLSKVKHGKETPSASLTGMLALLAARPTRLSEVKHAWATCSLPPRVVSTDLSRVELQFDSDLPVAC